LSNCSSKGGITVNLPNNSQITSIGTGLLHNLTKDPIQAQIFGDNDLHASLISVSDLTKQGCTVMFKSNSLDIVQPSGQIISYPKNLTDKLWTIPLQSTTLDQLASKSDPSSTSSNHSYINAAVHHQINAEYVKYAHATMGSPSLSTFINAIARGYFNNFPRLTVEMVNTNPPITIATAAGHLDQQRQIIRAQGPSGAAIQAPMTVVPIDRENSLNILPLPARADPDHLIYAKVWDLNDDIHVDLMGKFPYLSQRGNQYILVSTFHRYIHIEVMPNRSAGSYLQAFKATHQFFLSKGHIIHSQMMDKETSGTVEQYLKNEAKIGVIYAPTSTHRRNKAEKAIRTVKNHIISTLATADPGFPLSLWDELMPQVEITVNLLRGYQLNPAISSYHGIFGTPYNFLNHPMAPCGTKVVVLEPSDKRASWAPHGLVGYYLGPEINSYRSYRVYIPTTNGIRTSDSLAWFPTTFVVPGSSKFDIINTNLEALLQSLTALGSQRLATTASLPFNDLIQQSVTNLYEAITMLHPAPGATASSETINNPIQRVLDVPSSDTNTHTGGVQRVFTDNTTELPSPTSNEASTATSSEDTLASTPDVADPLNKPHKSRQRTYKQQSKRGANKLKQPHLQQSELDLAELPAPSTADRDHKITRTRKKPMRYANMIKFAQHFAYTAVNLDLQGIPLTYRSAKSGPDSPLWTQAEAEEIERLLDTDTGRFISMSDKPADRQAAYANPQPKIKIKDGKPEYRMRLTIGGDKIDYDGDVHANTAHLTTIKLLLNAVVSEHAKFMTMDIKDFYLGTPLLRKEYMSLSRRHVPQSIIDKYNLEPMFHNNHILMEISKGIYGLPQAGKLAQDQLFKHLEAHGYYEARNTPCLFRHKTRNIAFSLVVDDFGIKYSDPADAQHLLETLQLLYTMKVDWTGASYIGLTIKQDHENHTLSISMPNYIQQALIRFGITPSNISTDSPLLYVPPVYGSSKQQKPTTDDTPKLNDDQIKRLQEVVGVLLYYARAVDPTIIVAVHKIASKIHRSTAATNSAADRLLQYVASHPVAVITYHASKMILCIHSDASYLSETEARSRAGGLMYLSNDSNPVKTLVNGPIDCISTIIGQVVSSAFEAEYAALFICGQTGEAIRNTLSDLGYPQPPTIIICDNKSTVGVVTHTAKQRNSKAIDMRYHWIRDRADQGHFKILWYPAKYNLADYFTKAHPVYHVKALRKYFVESKQQSLLEGVLIEQPSRRGANRQP